MKVRKWKERDGHLKGKDGIIFLKKSCWNYNFTTGIISQ
jgi:hypothetical protein